jgi:riboflavin synthase alpha subunit
MSKENKIKENDIVTLVLTNGAEVIGRYQSEDMMSYTIERPRLVQVNEKGVALVDGVCMTGDKVDGTLQFNKTCVSFILPTMQQIAEGWQTQTSGIQVPQKSVIL